MLLNSQAGGSATDPTLATVDLRVRRFIDEDQPAPPGRTSSPTGHGSRSSGRMADQFHVQTTRNEDESAVVLECGERVEVNRWSAGREDKIKLSIWVAKTRMTRSFAGFIRPRHEELR